MIRITKISFTNYRAFFNDVDKEDEYVIELPKGQNLLVYGENGSGKSSLFKGIMEFFYSANESIDITYPSGLARLSKANSLGYFCRKQKL